MRDLTEDRVGIQTDALTGSQQPSWRLPLLAASTLLLLLPTIARSNDDAIRDALIRQSIANYQGNCPCPYSKDRAGRNCGRRSAYSRPGGAAPLCYREDVTQEMIERFRKRGD